MEYTLPCLQSRRPEWTRCKGWMTNSWPLLCGHRRHGWVWRCCLNECPNWGEIRQIQQLWRCNINYVSCWIVLLSDFTWLLTSWAFGHRLQIRRVTRAASAMRRPPPQQCDQWRWSLPLRSSPPSAQHLCPTDKLSKTQTDKNTFGDLIKRLSYGKLLDAIAIKPECSLTWSSEALRREPDRFGFQERP